MLPATRSGLVEKSELTDMLSDIIRFRPSSRPVAFTPDTDWSETRLPVKIVVIGSDAAIADVSTAWLWLNSHHAQLISGVDVSFLHLCLTNDVAQEDISTSQNVASYAFHNPPEDFERSIIQEEEEIDVDGEDMLAFRDSSSGNVASVVTAIPSTPIPSSGGRAKEWDHGVDVDGEGADWVQAAMIGSQTPSSTRAPIIADFENSAFEENSFNSPAKGVVQCLPPHPSLLEDLRGETIEEDGHFETSLTTIDDRHERSFTLGAGSALLTPIRRRHTLADTLDTRRISVSEWTPFQEEFEATDAMENFWVSKPLEYVTPLPAVDPVAGSFVFDWLCKDDWILRRQAIALRSILASASIITSLFAKPSSHASAPPALSEVQSDIAPQYLAAQLLFRLCGHARSRSEMLIYQVELRLFRSPHDSDSGGGLASGKESSNTGSTSGKDGNSTTVLSLGSGGSALQNTTSSAPAGGNSSLVVILVRYLRFDRGTGPAPQVRLDLLVSNAQESVTQFRGQPQSYDSISLVRIPPSKAAVPYPSPNTTEMELSYCRKNRTTAMLVHSCTLTCLDEMGFVVNVDGRVFDRVASVKVSPATSLAACAGGYREQNISLPLARCTDPGSSWWSKGL